MIIKLKGLSELQDLQLPTICQETDDEGCTYYYSYKQKHNISNIYVVENKECPEGPDILLIVLAVVGGTAGIGLTIWNLWILRTAVVDIREWQRFQKDRARAKWIREQNPLYRPATSTIQNPIFVGSRT
mgnify:FL=1